MPTHFLRRYPGRNHYGSYRQQNGTARQPEPEHLGKESPKTGWDYYQDVANAVDNDLESNWNDDLDSLLIVVSLD